MNRATMFLCSVVLLLAVMPSTSDRPGSDGDPVRAGPVALRGTTWSPTLGASGSAGRRRLLRQPCMMLPEVSSHSSGTSALPGPSKSVSRRWCTPVNYFFEVAFALSDKQILYTASDYSICAYNSTQGANLWCKEQSTSWTGYSLNFAGSVLASALVDHVPVIQALNENSGDVDWEYPLSSPGSHHRFASKTMADSSGHVYINWLTDAVVGDSVIAWKMADGSRSLAWTWAPPIPFKLRIVNVLIDDGYQVFVVMVSRSKYNHEKRGWPVVLCSLRHIDGRLHWCSPRLTSQFASSVSGNINEWIWIGANDSAHMQVHLTVASSDKQNGDMGRPGKSVLFLSWWNESGTVGAISWDTLRGNVLSSFVDSHTLDESSHAAYSVQSFLWRPQPGNAPLTEGFLFMYCMWTDLSGHSFTRLLRLNPSSLEPVPSPFRTSTSDVSFGMWPFAYISSASYILCDRSGVIIIPGPYSLAAVDSATAETLWTTAVSDFFLPTVIGPDGDVFGYSITSTGQEICRYSSSELPQ